jgi:hypothetical protein
MLDCDPARGARSRTLLTTSNGPAGVTCSLNPLTAVLWYVAREGANTLSSRTANM